MSFAITRVSSGVCAGAGAAVRAKRPSRAMNEPGSRYLDMRTGCTATRVRSATHRSNGLPMNRSKQSCSGCIPNRYPVIPCRVDGRGRVGAHFHHPPVALPTLSQLSAAHQRSQRRLVRHNRRSNRAFAARLAALAPRSEPLPDLPAAAQAARQPPAPTRQGPPANRSVRPSQPRRRRLGGTRPLGDGRHEPCGGIEDRRGLG